VMIDGALWRARTHRHTPVAAGEQARVVSLEGLTLAVEPVAGSESS